MKLLILIGAKPQLGKVGTVGELTDHPANLLSFRDLAQAQISLETWGMKRQGCALCTLARQESIGDPGWLPDILAAMCAIARELPLHRRTRYWSEQHNQLADFTGRLLVDTPVYLELQRLQMSALIICSHSRGVQNEVCFHGVFRITLCDETERIETVEAGWNQLAGLEQRKIVAAFRNAVRADGPQSTPCGDKRMTADILARFE